ncbi:MAG: DNA polymerase III subunit gamma/tau, partial [Negativicutes bacterium]|nr:DNA polymerase III subunit gamma/tau [Negativicutes bacterium]
RDRLTQALLRRRVAHAYLFSGPRGTGKTSLARILAKALNCRQPVLPEPCNQCDHCRAIDSGSFLDVVEIDAASNRGIDDARALRSNMSYVAVAGQFKVYIIDEAHMLTSEAFNALLKMLEEPPDNVVFILATTAAGKIPQTVQSRCQCLDFRGISTADITARLLVVAENGGYHLTGEAAGLIAGKSKGGLRDALSMLQQCLLLSQNQQADEQLVREILGLPLPPLVTGLEHAIWQGDTAEAVSLVEQAWQNGVEPQVLVEELAAKFRGRLSREGLTGDDEVCTGLLAVVELFYSAVQDIGRGYDGRTTTELAVIRACRRKFSSSLQELSLRIRQLEDRLDGVVTACPTKDETADVTLPAATGQPDGGGAEKASAAVRPAAAGVIGRPAANRPASAEPCLPECEQPVIQDLEQLWRDVWQRLSEVDDRSLKIHLENFCLAGIVGETATIACVKGRASQFTVSSLMQPKRRQAIERILSDVCGRQLKLAIDEGTVSGRSRTSTDKNSVIEKINRFFPNSRTEPSGDR